MKLLEIAVVAEGIQRYKQLEARDQLAVKGLAIFFAALLLYGLESSARGFYDDRLTEFERNQSLVQYMRATERDARAKANGAPAIGGQNLMSSVSNSAKRFGITPNRLQPEGSSGVSVWFESVSFAVLLEWVTSVSQQGSVSIRQISIDRNEDPGVVSARVILEG